MMMWRLLTEPATTAAELRRRSRAWLVVISIEVIVILTVGGLVVGSLYLRTYTREVCTSLNHGFSYVNTLNQQRIASLRVAIQTDSKAGRAPKVRDERKALLKAEQFQSAIRPPHC